jgi:hypothetical protein
LVQSQQLGGLAQKAIAACTETWSAPAGAGPVSNVAAVARAWTPVVALVITPELMSATAGPRR